MKLAFIHYHLNRGGVAQVLVDHVAGLDLLPASQAPEQVAVLSGGRHDGWPADFASKVHHLDVRFATVDGLDYDDNDAAAAPAELADELAVALRGLGFAQEETVLHVHNHALGKNVSLPGALHLLAERGYRQLLQVHDFAEDFRPRNYHRLATAIGAPTAHELAEALYPQAPHVHYAVLNDRDHAVLRSAGVADERLHLLPNAVAERSSAADRAAVRARLEAQLGIAPDSHYLLYPARGIRRKNLGEALLWATLFGPTVHVGVTLPPLNPSERCGYARWRSFATAHALPCAFETGCLSGLSLAENFLASDQVLTTSVAEGFGLAFLESYLAGRAPIGRNLPEITAGFVRAGVTFPGLGERVNVPEHWIGRSRLVTMFERTYNATLACYGRPGLPRAEIEFATASKLEDGFVDFADLDASTQATVLCAVDGDQRRRAQLIDVNRWMADALDDDGREVKGNAAIIRGQFSHQATGVRLVTAYRQVMAAAPAPLEPLSGGETILDSFLSFERFRAVLA